jgi:dinuclear metal center YbgI/SA1388 family protein
MVDSTPDEGALGVRAPIASAVASNVDRAAIRFSMGGPSAASRVPRLDPTRGKALPLARMNVANLVRAMETVAPTQFAASWDNVGLLVGDPAAELSRVLLTIDCTRAVLEEAKAGAAQAIVSYHPPIFAAQKRFVAGSVAFEAARAGVAIHSPHTALDVAEGGTNDVLADVLGMRERAPLRPAGGNDAELKLVTFIPAAHVEAVSASLFAAGAGRIGRYSSCSFRASGTGTFFGEEGADPVVGLAGRLEHAPEVRVETVVPAGDVAAVVKALRATHPYEEPAFDLVRLAAGPQRRGLGLVGAIDPAGAHAVVDRVKAALGVEQVLVAGPLDREVRRAAVCAGSGGDLLDDAITLGAELFLTGELRHHDALRAAERGVTAVCTRHSISERAALAALEARLAALLPGVVVARSAVDRDPFELR